MSPLLTRRAVVAGGAMLAAACALPRALLAAAPADPVAPTETRITPRGGRAFALTSWTPAAPRGVLVFSHGHGSWPERYARLADLLTDAGYAVFAPLHVDSVRSPDRAAFTREASLPARLADMAATLDHVARRHPGLPVGAAGHSFGTLIALALAGGLPRLGDVRAPAVRTVLGFSSPGNVPGLVTPDAYATVAVPLMLVTGTADTVPGLVTDPTDHLLAARTAAAGPRAVYVVGGGGHELIGEARPMRRVAAPVQDFLAATLMGDERAGRRLAAYRPAAPDILTLEANPWPA